MHNTNHFHIRSRAARCYTLNLQYEMKRIQSEQFTFWIVVEDTVVGAGVRMAVPESVSTGTQRRQLYLVLLQFLLQQSLHSLNVPVTESSHAMTALYMLLNTILIF